MLAPQPSHQFKNFEKMIPPHLLATKQLQAVYKQLREEIDKDYEMSARKCIGQFVIS